ncbi:MAG: enoyl-CoA hydratase/isomerase family protein [Bacillota bacterium]
MKTDFNNLNVEVEERVAVVTINRPEVRNALNKETWVELKEFLSEAEAEEQVHIVIFTGAGDKAFVAGADVAALKQRSMLETLKGEN